ncbi:hypothetical protein W97_05298 [Coniosporium apollinis CBS 100218]|uniref:5-formyltetrahydrofolate cyclo-ligase n=1 Tax=Coniosporium apollinis (strain CBS 100218) TaxID=1168221 RepID=R7YVW0_CONA1|nr:uncharacterized protein W97_05298 [Coniosporium apollinis CBS 100218]EON66055.1 hypothetical protein W97_05298 [Coniosporium apollinis CBS 100218]
MAALKAAKQDLRKHIKSILSEISEDAVARQSSSAVKRLISMPEYQAAKRISIYLSMPSGEISTVGIVHDALKSGKKVFVPYTHKLQNAQAEQPSSIMDMLQLHSLADYDSLKPDKWGIPSLNADSVSSRENCFGDNGVSDGRTVIREGGGTGLDLIVMPGMAFDTKFGRLGHGKGFYDFFMERCLRHSRKNTSSNMPFLVGLALSEQVLPDDQLVPVDSTDWRLDALVTGGGNLSRRD